MKQLPSSINYQEFYEKYKRLPYYISLWEAVILTISWIVGVIWLYIEGISEIATPLLLLGWIVIILFYIGTYSWLSIILSPTILRTDAVIKLEKQFCPKESDPTSGDAEKVEYVEDSNTTTEDSEKNECAEDSDETAKDVEKTECVEDFDVTKENAEKAEDITETATEQYLNLHGETIDFEAYENISDFIEEIRNTSTEALKLILADQRELYSDEEIKIIMDELKRRI